MKRIVFLSILLIIFCFEKFAIAQPYLIITGIYDGPLTGGLPKGIELYVIANISDLSAYGLGAANNGGGTDGEEYTFPTDAVTAGDYISVAYEDTLFTTWFGSAPDYISGSMSINGDDAIELFYNGFVVDVYGDINTAGTGEAWEYLDGWAYSKSNRGVSTTFSSSHWTFSGINALDGETTNGSASTPVPIGTFSYTDGSLPVKLTFFNAVSRDSKIILSWVTESEIDNLGFLLERRAESTEHGGWETVADYQTIGALTGQGSVTHRTEYRYTDERVRVGQTYVYQLVDVDYNGKKTRHDPVTVTVRARGVTMNSAYPNPFNPVTTLSYILPVPSHVNLTVYDMHGRAVTTLINTGQGAGYKSTRWDATNEGGRSVSAGVYFFQIKAGDFIQTKKMILLK